MKRFTKMVLPVGLLVVIALMAGLAQAKSLDEILKAGEIRVGINPTLPPLGVFNDKNEIDGFDKDVAQAIADALGVKLTIVKVGSPDRIPFVATDKIDFVMGAMTRNPKRAQIIDFTLPVHTEVFGVLTTTENKKPAGRITMIRRSLWSRCAARPRCRLSKRTCPRQKCCCWTTIPM